MQIAAPLSLPLPLLWSLPTVPSRDDGLTVLCYLKDSITFAEYVAAHLPMHCEVL